MITTAFSLQQLEYLLALMCPDRQAADDGMTIAVEPTTQLTRSLCETISI